MIGLKGPEIHQVYRLLHKSQATLIRCPQVCHWQNIKRNSIYRPPNHANNKHQSCHLCSATSRFIENPTYPRFCILETISSSTQPYLQQPSKPLLLISSRISRAQVRPLQLSNLTNQQGHLPAWLCALCNLSPPKPHRRGSSSKRRRLLARRSRKGQAFQPHGRMPGSSHQQCKRRDPRFLHRGRKGAIWWRGRVQWGEAFPLRQQDGGYRVSEMGESGFGVNEGN